MTMQNSALASADRDRVRIPQRAAAQSAPWAGSDVPIPLVLLDRKGSIVDFNDRAEALLGPSAGGLLRCGAPLAAMLGPVLRDYLDWINGDLSTELKTQVWAGGQMISAVLTARECALGDGQRVVAVQPEAARTVANAKSWAFDEATSGMFVTTPSGRIVAANPSFIEMVHESESSVIGLDWRKLLLGGLKSSFADEIAAELDDRGAWRGTVVVGGDSPDARILELSLARGAPEPARAQEEGMPVVNVGMVAQVRDVTEGSSVEQALKEQARSDQLTGLLNRAGFLEVLEERFEEAQRNGTRLSLMYLDLDRFKSLNDHFGHRYGDILLEAFAKRLRSSLKSTDVIGRVGGDEFTVLFDPGLNPATLSNVVHKLKSKLLEDYQLAELNYTCTASFGSAEYPWDASTADQLLEYADHAMYQAKTEGRNKHTRFDRKVFRNWADREDLLQSIEAGIDEMLFVPYYQPIFDTASRQLRGAEALVRWIDPESPADPRLPAQFLSLVDGSPAGVRMGIRMLDQVVVHMRSFAETIAPVPVSVNLSAAQLRAEDIVAHIETLAERFPQEVQRLTVELVESAFYDGDPIIANNLQRLVAVGASLSLDDFGTGHSSLLSLRAHDFTELKIDREFLVAATEGGPEDVVVLESMIELSRRLGMETVCEGVETAEQLDYLNDLGCRSVQGFLLGRPMPKDEFRSLLTNTELAGSVV